MAGRPIEHVVVLMLENRSFDHLLGFLDHPDPRYPRLRPGAFDNPADPADPGSRRVPVTPEAARTIPVDPPHSHQSVMEQLNLKGLAPARMDGFVAAYARKARGEEPRPVVHWWRIAGLVLALCTVPAALLSRLGPIGRRLALPAYLALTGAGSLALRRAKRRVDHVEPLEAAGEVMHGLTPDKVPVLSTLAKEFAVCTRWHCSVPGETWPNRNFVHAATSEETVDIEIGFYEAPTVFEVIEEHGASWRVYHQGRAHLWAFWKLWRDEERLARWDSFDAFARHVATGDLAAYSFIEPDHEGRDSASQHPGNNGPGSGGVDFVRAEALVADVYETLRRHPEVFARTLLVVTYDEHGGFFDHVPPPTGVAAPVAMGRRLRLSRRLVAFFVERRTVRFRFRTLGPRVPAVVVSPLIPPGTIDGTLYDHSSVVATVRTLFAPGADPLTARDGAAHTFEGLATLPAPRAGRALPDLSRRPAPPVPPGPGAAGGARERDEFARQLERLGEQVRARLDRRVAPAPAPPARAAGSPHGAAETDDEVVAAFRRASRGARLAAGGS